MTNYPDSVPLLELKSAVDIIRKGEVQAKAPTFAHDLWTIQGYGQKMLVGSPTPDFAVISKADAFDAVGTMEKIISQAEGNPTAQLDMPWRLLVRWVVDQLVDLLEKQLIG
jgi:hypothetical protein